MPTKTLFRFRRFLNRITHQTTAHVFVEVTKDYSRKKNDDYTYWFFTFDLSDCSRTINLDFSVSSERERKNGKHKLSQIREALDGFENAFNQACEEKEEEEKKEKEEKERKKKEKKDKNKK